jgi:hypothetical protein
MTHALELIATGKLLHVKVTGKLSKEDYESFAPTVDGLIEEHGKIRILFEMHDFHCWTAGALWEDTKFDFKHWKDIEKLVIVGESKWEAAAQGDVKVIEDWKITGAGVTSRLNKILKRLGIPKWPRPWQNMRATRETELNDRFPEHVVCTWLGTSPKVAREHYLRVAKEHMTRALEAPEVKGEVNPPARMPKVK